VVPLLAACARVLPRDVERSCAWQVFMRYARSLRTGEKRSARARNGDRTPWCVAQSARRTVR